MKKVLVVDDAKNIRLLLTRCLENEGYLVHTATTGREALEKLLSETYNLVFLDIKLPEMSGTEVLRQIRTQGIETPAIIITAYPTVKNAVECTKLGSIVYLQKPFTATRLLNTIKEIDLEIRGGVEEETDRIENMIAENRLADALAALKAALAREPMDSDLYRLMSRVYHEKGEMETAKKFMEAAKIFDS